MHQFRSFIINIWNIIMGRRRRNVMGLMWVGNSKKIDDVAEKWILQASND